MIYLSIAYGSRLHLFQAKETIDITFFADHVNLNVVLLH